MIIRGEQRIVLPSDLHAQATALVHKLAHVGMTNTESLLTSRFWFPGYSTIVQAEVDWCDTCTKTVVSKQQEPIGDTVTPTTAFEILSIDFKGPMSDGYYALVILDVFTKCPHVSWVKSTSFEAI